MMDNLTVKRADLCEARDIMHITKEAFAWYVKMSGAKRAEALEEGLAAVEADIKNKYVYCAYKDGQMVGSLRVEVNIKEEYAYLSRFGVLTEYRNMGIGKALMEEVDRMLISLGVKKLFLHTAEKINMLMKFYKNMGFSVETSSRSNGYQRALLVKVY